MDRNELKNLQDELLKALPASGKKKVSEVLSKVTRNDATGYQTSNARAALLTLADNGKVALDSTGNVSRR